MSADTVTSERDAVLDAARRARDASTVLAPATRATKDAAIRAMADALDARADEVVAANAGDVDACRRGRHRRGTRRPAHPHPRAARAPSPTRCATVAELPDPVGEVVRGYTLPNGLEVRQVRVPLGVVGIIYEARPNVTVDAAGLCLKSGNAVLLRGSSSAFDSNAALVAVMQDALEASGLPRDAVQLVPGTTHEAAKHLMTARGLVDVLIPRGGAGLIRSVVEESTVPVIETGVGNCHVYIDAAADVDKAVRLLVNAKTQRPSVCNAAETFLVHADIADAFLPPALAALKDAGVTVHGDAAHARVRGGEPASASPTSPTRTGPPSTTRSTSRRASSTRSTTPSRTSGAGRRATPRRSSPRTSRRPAGSSPRSTPRPSWSTPRPGSPTAASSASAPRSASRTQKLHARGPMGLPELTSTKYVVTGDGHVRA